MQCTTNQSKDVNAKQQLGLNGAALVVSMHAKKILQQELKQYTTN